MAYPTFFVRHATIHALTPMVPLNLSTIPGLAPLGPRFKYYYYHSYYYYLISLVPILFCDTYRPQV